MENNVITKTLFLNNDYTILKEFFYSDYEYVDSIDQIFYNKDLLDLFYNNALQDIETLLFYLNEYKYNKQDIDEFLQWFESTDNNTFIDTIYNNHKFNLIYDATIDDEEFDDIDSRILLSTIIYFKDSTLVSFYKSYNIPIEYLGHNIYFIDLSKINMIGFGANGISILTNSKETIIKITTSITEYQKTLHLLELNDMDENVKLLKKHFCKIYSAESCNGFFIIEREFIIGDTPEDEDEIFYSKEYSEWEELLETDLGYYGISNFWDIHSNNCIINPKGKDVSFIYFDY